MTCITFSSFVPQRWWIHREGQMHLGQPCLRWEDGWPHSCHDHICASGYSPASYGLTAPTPFMPCKKLLWIKCKSWILNESWICALLSNSRNFSESSFSKFYKVHKKCFTCAKLIISWRNQGCLAASTFIRVAKGLPKVLIIKAPSFANGNIILLCPCGSLCSSVSSSSSLFVWFLPLPPLPLQPL